LYLAVAATQEEGLGEQGTDGSPTVDGRTCEICHKIPVS
jgi:hypothetical protein